MNIYKVEKELGLEDKIANAKATSSICLPIKLKTSEEAAEAYAHSLQTIDSAINSKVAELIKRANTEAVANKVNPYMMYGSAILVSTVMNRNDDVFLPETVWASRKTPINTPYNDQHVRSEIIGHIYNCKAVDADLNTIPDDSNPPEFFHLVADFVLYQFIFPEIAREVSEGASMGTRFVSMECMFDDFSYGLFDEQGKAAKIIDRNEKTSFLTQYLRAYGGTGKFGNYRVGRVLKDIHFVGMGNVDTPANPQSEYITIHNFSFASVDNVQDEKDLKTVMYNTNERPDDSVGDSFYHVNKGKAMKIETLEQAQELIAKLEKQISDSENAQKIAEVQAQLEATTEERDSLVSELESLKTEKSEADEALEAAQAELGSVKEEHDALKAEVEEAKAEQAARERLSQLQEAGVKVEDEDKELAELRKMNDETFASILAYAKRIAVSETDDDEANNLTPGQEESTASKNADEELNNAEENSELNLAGEETEEDTLQVSAAKLACAVLKIKKEESK